jgi:ABC-type hemin transport system substrate-binding protein
VAIRGLQAESLSAGSQIKWQVLVIQPTKNAPTFNGKLEITLSGLQGGAPGTGAGGKPWVQVAGGAAQSLQFTQYKRLENVIDLPPQVVVKQVSAKVTEGAATRAVQTLKI